MENYDAFSSKDNPYQFIERNGGCLNDYLASQKLDGKWSINQLKLLWAFQGLLQKNLFDYNPKDEFAVYAYEPDITSSLPSKTLFEILADKPDGIHLRNFNFDLSNEDNYVVFDHNLLYKLLPLSEVNQILREGCMNKGEGREYNPFIIKLQSVFKHIGHLNANKFKIISRIGTSTDIFSALCIAFEIEDNETWYLERSKIGPGHSDNSLMHPFAKNWLSNWVEDENLKAHLSCFMDKNRGSIRYRSLYLSCFPSRIKTNPDLAEVPFGLNILNSIMKVDFLMGWEWRNIDLMSSKAIIQIKR